MMSAVRKFRSQPITGPDESFSFVVYGDMGVTADPGSHDTAKYMIEEAAKGRSLVFHVGDISYARGYVRKGFQYDMLSFLSSFIRLKTDRRICSHFRAHERKNTSCCFPFIPKESSGFH